MLTSSFGWIGFFAAARAAGELDRAVRDHLVDVHVRLRAAAGLPDDEREVDRRACPRSPRRPRRRSASRLSVGQQAELVVDERGRLLERRERARSSRAACARSPIRKFCERALRLRAPVAVVLDVDRAHAVGLDARRHARDLPPRDGQRDRAHRRRSVVRRASLGHRVQLLDERAHDRPREIVRNRRVAREHDQHQPAIALEAWPERRLHVAQLRDPRAPALEPLEPVRAALPLESPWSRASDPDPTSPNTAGAPPAYSACAASRRSRSPSPCRARWARRPCTSRGRSRSWIALEADAADDRSPSSASRTVSAYALATQRTLPHLERLVLRGERVPVDPAMEPRESRIIGDA